VLAAAAMKAISLWQPWATAIALGHKTIETRGFYTHYRGPLAIHAAKRFGGNQHQVLRRSGLQCDSLPLGAIVAVARLVDVVPTQTLANEIDATELFWGDYAPGRFGWILRDIEALEVPLPWQGKQGFFEVSIAPMR
jgi:hypothetical protein